MKKFFYLLVLAFMPMCFTACGGDDDESSSGSSSQKSLLIGSWERIKIVSYNAEGKNTSNSNTTVIDTYYADGTMQHGSKNRRFYWKLEGTTLTITDNGEDEVYTILTLDQNNMVLRFEYRDGRYQIETYNRVTDD